VRDEEGEKINEERKQGKGYSTSISPREMTPAIFNKSIRDKARNENCSEDN
jgi:hypothetical protein